MTSITLFPLDRAAAAELAANPADFARRSALVFTPHEESIAMIASATAQLLATNGAAMPWGGYLTVDGAGTRVIGTCGFKGGPDSSGTVEIAYFSFPGEEGRGVATAMAGAMVRLASADEHGVAVVCAHTLPERNASCRVLEKNGFHFVGDVIDPEDGPIWRWERPVVRAG